MRQSFVSTEIDFLEPGETPNEGSATNWQPGWESEEVDVSLSMHELQLESPTPSTSKSSARRRKQKKPEPRKKEESGICGQCDEKFSRKSNAMRHEIAVHGKMLHFCGLCDVSCNRPDALKKHMRVQHKVQHDDQQ